jgi:hypothetical protein
MVWLSAIRLASLPWLFYAWERGLSAYVAAEAIFVGGGLPQLSRGATIGS